MEPLSTELLTLYGFKLIDPTTAQGGDTWEREGFQITEVDGTREFIYGKGADKVLIESFERLQELWKKEKGTELTLSV